MNRFKLKLADFIKVNHPYLFYINNRDIKLDEFTTYEKLKRDIQGLFILISV
jgi:hypothetical protein